MLDKREGSIWLFKWISLFQKESIFLKKSAKHLNFFVNSICRNGKRLALKSILKQISYESVFFNAPNRIWIQAPQTIVFWRLRIFAHFATSKNFFFCQYLSTLPKYIKRWVVYHKGMLILEVYSAHWLWLNAYTQKHYREQWVCTTYMTYMPRKHLEHRLKRPFSSFLSVLDAIGFKFS